MATRGIAYSTANISSFSPSENPFSIKNILNLSDAEMEKDAAPIEVVNAAPCSAPSFLVKPHAVFPPGFHSQHWFGLPGISSIPSPQPVVQIIPFNVLPNHVASFGKLTTTINRPTVIAHFFIKNCDQINSNVSFIRIK